MIRERGMRCVCIGVLVVVGLIGAPVAAAGSAAEELTRRLPDDVIGFVAMSGCDALEADFGKTALGKILNDPGVQSFAHSVQSGLLTLLQERSGDSDVRQTVDLALQYAQLACRRPLVVGISQMAVEDGLPFCVFAIADAGGRKAELAAAVSKLEAMAGDGTIVDTRIGELTMRAPKAETDMPLYWGWVGDYLVFAANDPKGMAIAHVKQARATVSSYLANVPGHGDAFVMCYDYQKFASLITALVRKDGGEREANMIATLFKDLGLGDLKMLTARVGFDGPDVVSDVLLEMPRPAPGVFGTVKPVNPSWFRAVDSRAVTASAINWDLASLYDMSMTAVKTASPDEAFPAIQEAISSFESESSVRIRDGLLASLAGPMVSSSLPATGVIAESPFGGFMLVAKLKDASLFEKTMAALGTFVAAKAEGVLQISSQARDDGRTVHVWAVAPLAMMNVMPAWSVVKNHVVIASNTALCDLGVKQLVSKREDVKSLLDAEGYKKIAAKLPKDLISLSYTDSRVQLNQSMMQMQQVWPMLTMFAMRAGIKLPVMVPSLTHIAEDMGPSYSYRHLDPKGLRVHYRGSGIEAGPATLAGVAVGAGIMMPALARVREQARSVSSMANMRQIAVGLTIYADEHEGKLPATLEDLEEYGIEDTVRRSPRRPKSFKGPSYIYIPGQSANTKQAGRYIVVYENPEFCKDKINVLFLDAHVESMKPDAFRRALDATYKRLGRETPEVESKGPSGRSLERVPATTEPAPFALHAAAGTGDMEEAKALIAAGADMDARNEREETPLCLALNAGRLDVATLLIREGADVNMQGGRWGHPLNVAARFGYTDIAEQLIDDGANVEATLGGGWTPLLLAVRFGHTGVAQALIANGADLKAQTSQAMSPMSFAVLHKRKEIEALLAARGIQTDIFTESMRGNADGVAALLDSDRSLVNETRAHFTPLHWATYCGHLDTARVLLNSGADVNANLQYAPPLYWAVRKSHEEIIALLLAEGADPNAKGRNGGTVLYHAVTREAAEMLVNNGAEVNAVDQRGVTPLHAVASEWAHRGALKLLLPADADINAEHPDALHRKATQRQAQVAHVLLAHGAQVDAKDKHGITALDVAEKAGYDAVVEVLRRRAEAPTPR